MRKIIFVFLLCVFDVFQGTSAGIFYGGSISYTIKNSTNTGKPEIHLNVITGWKLGEGPCGPGCGNKDVGKSTMVLRNATPFGNWSEIIKTLHVRDRAPQDITSTIIANAETQVLAVSETDKWEQELLQSTIQLEDNFEYIDFMHRGMSWHDLKQGYNLPWKIQTKVVSKKRNDTGNLNNSPVVMVRPLYRVELNTINKIQIHATDPDDDFVKCREANYNEAGGFRKLKGMTVKENCEIELNTSASNGYNANDWMAVIVEVDDYNRYPIMFGQDPYKTAQFGLSSTTVQFRVKVMTDIKAPSFVDPTMANGHVFEVYFGATWKANVYSQPTTGKTIDTFTFNGRHQEHIQSTIKENYPVISGVVFTTLSWKPTAADIGQHIICVRVVDNTGIESLEDRCFLLKVKENTFNILHAPTISDRPYFIDFPTLTQVISCTLGSTCVFPIFIKSNAPIQIVKTTKNPQGTVTIGQTFTQVTHNNESVYTTDLSFMHDVDGAFQVCIDATDTNGKSSDTSCVNIDVIPQDPCLTTPCKNSADCHAKQSNRTDYTCTCITTQFYGKDCEHKMDPCTPDPCFHGAYCIDTFPTAYCYCSGDWKGSFCNETDKCLSQPTNATTSMVQTVNGMKVGDTTTYTCHTGYEDRTSLLTIKCLLSGEWELPPTCTLKDPCLARPCKNSADCHANTTNTTDYTCTCITTQFYGKDCERKKDPCSPNPCFHGATCYDTFPTVYCVCSGDWKGSFCNETDKCTVQPTNGTTSMIQTVSGMKVGDTTTYTCHTGYEDVTSSLTIQCLLSGDWELSPTCTLKDDIDNCLPDPCHGHGVCTDQIDYFRCDCYDRYSDVDCAIDLCPRERPDKRTCPTGAIVG